MATINPRKTRDWSFFFVAAMLAFVVIVVVAKTSHQKFSDAQFAAKAAQGALAEVQLGQLAAQKGETEAVRAFGQRMATDHARTNQKLRKIAARENIRLPEDPDKDAKQNYEKLSKLSGPAFDRSYAQDMVADHKKDVSEFQKETATGENEAIRTFADETLPTLQHHLKEASEIKENILEKSIPTLPKY
jgi:putative membrane protein